MVKFIPFFLFTPLIAVNFSEDISPIIYNNCTECHRPGEIGSFMPLTNYQEVAANATLIKFVIHDGEDRHGNPVMPPWPADRNYRSTVGERYLTEAEIDLISHWVDEGAIQGDPALEFPLHEFPESSIIGEPDVVLSMVQSYQIQAGDADEFRCFVLPTNFEEDKDVALLEFRPGNRELVHHAIAIAAPHGSADYLEDDDLKYGYDCFWGFGVNSSTGIIASYLPGQTPIKLKHGLGQSIPANSDILVQIHYPTVEEDTEDLSQINIFLSDEPVERYANFTYLDDWSFSLPPNQLTEVYDSFYIPTAKSLVSFNPHCHWLGKSWEAYATVPGSIDPIPIIKIDQWDFFWQNVYFPQKLIHLPAGSTIHLYCTYDNTVNNPDNPFNPPQWVYPGAESEDEMFSLDVQMVNYLPGDEDLFLGRLPGDINADDEVNIVDVILLVDFVLNTSAPSYQEFKNSDLNRDYQLNVVDVVDLVNIILGD